MKIYLDKKEKEIAKGITGEDLAKEYHLMDPDVALAAFINGKESDLSTPLHEGDEISFIDFSSHEGKEIFWHTSAHVLAQAICRLFPEAVPTIGPAIENGFYYDFANLTISENDFARIEKEIEGIIKENSIPKRMVFSSKEEAKEAFSHNPFKNEIIDGFSDETISAYKQGEFIDLCRGPHLPSLKKIKALKLLKTSGAYWRGDKDRDMLTRIYGISFPDRKMLKEYLYQLEEAKKRDHKLLGKRLDLFSFKEEAPGMPFFHPKGLIMWEALISFIRKTLSDANYLEIKTPMIMSKELWIRSGHWMHYREHMYTSEVEGQEFAIKPMNCPGCMLYYKTHLHSYKELPLKIAEIGHVHRYEHSGALQGLFRVRGFHQDDAHIFMHPTKIKESILEALSIANYIYQTFGLSYKIELSTRPEKSKTIGTDEEWENATQGLIDALDDWGHSYQINEGDGAFYGPKIDIHIRDAIGRFWQMGTIQLDMSLPEKFDLHFIDSDGMQKRPVMIHRALLGSIERFFAVIIEHFGGNFPLWISPLGVRIIPVADRHVPYAQELKKKIEEQKISCDIDDSHESVSKKIRNAQMQKANYMLTIGDKELESKTINLRTRDNVVHGQMSIDSFLEKAKQEKEDLLLMSPFTQTPSKGE